MGLIGGAIGAGISAIGGIFGGISASKAMKKVKRNIEQQQKENQDWYDRRYNEDATQRADAQRMITMVNDSIKKRNKQAAGAAAVMGGAEEAVAMAKEANNQALSDTTSQIVANAEQRKDNIEQQYLNRKADLNQQLNDLQMNKAQNTAQAIQGVTSAAQSIGNALPF